jgi:hypothetical protein
VRCLETVGFQLQLLYHTSVSWTHVIVDEAYRLGQNAFQNCFSRKLKTHNVNTLTPRTYSDFGVYLARGYQIAHIKPLRSHHWYRSICTTAIPTIVCRRVRNRCQVSYRQEVTACFTPVSVLNRVPSTCFLETEIAGLHAANRTRDRLWRKGTGERGWTILPTAPVSRGLRGFLWTTWLGSDLQQTPTSNKMSPPGYRHLFLIRQDTSLCATVAQVPKYQWWLCWGVMCTVRYTLSIYASKIEYFILFLDHLYWIQNWVHLSITVL